ncbi:hypothetical protein NEMBOFW57_009481 [Staphylotrichum longicolle]|uniref:Nephrocystin 3-like N-terminal domain-containing protein n=1 Tax=Staphylotrichum longicolle TaxID=669026 RepID=A0AAD4HVH5_9PEZI|nr:hypothetical protein NEMBOFW57_009481 [Staphylotrichum longicolle]
MPPTRPPERSLERLDSLPEASFDAANKQHVDICLRNTRCDVLAQIRRWANGDGGQRIYWLKGMAGTGKSTIALTVAREYSAKERLGASFFFSRGGDDLASTRRFAATIAVQLAEVSPQLRRHIADAAASTRRIHGLGLYDQWEKLVLRPLAQLGREAFPHPLIVVVDALDECDNDDDVSLLIRCMAAAVAVEHINIRVFVTSRPDQPISIGFNSIAAEAHQDFILHDIEQSIVDQDLAVYYEYQLGQMVRTSGLDAAVLRDGVIEKLAKKSCRLFIHAATACRFVREGGPLAGERLAHLISAERLPARTGTELDRMYTTVLEYSLNAQFDMEETARVQELFGRIVGSLAVLFDALSPDSLAMMLAEPKGKITSTLRSLHSVVDVPEQEGRLIRFLHPPEASIIRRLYMRQLPEWIIRAPALSEDWSVHLQTLSHLTAVHAVAVSSDGRLIVSGSGNNTLRYSDHMVRVWDAATGAERRVLQGHLDSVNAVAFSPDGQLIGMGCGHGRRVLHGHLDWGNAVAFSPDGQLIVSGSDDKTVRVWDAATGTERHVLQGHSRPARAVAFSPDGQLIVSGSDDKTVRVWDSATGAKRRVLQGHLDSVIAVAFSPDGRLIVSGSDDNTVRVWDAVTSAERRVLQGHSRPVSTVAFSPDGRLIVSGSRDKTARVWDAATGSDQHLLPIDTDLRSWVTDNGEELLYLHPDYQDSFGFVSSTVVVYTGRVSHALQLDLSRASDILSSA